MKLSIIKSLSIILVVGALIGCKKYEGPGPLLENKQDRKISLSADEHSLSLQVHPYGGWSIYYIIENAKKTRTEWPRNESGSPLPFHEIQGEWYKISRTELPYLNITIDKNETSSTRTLILELHGGDRQDEIKITQNK